MNNTKLLKQRTDLLNKKLDLLEDDLFKDWIPSEAKKV